MTGPARPDAPATSDLDETPQPQTTAETDETPDAPEAPADPQPAPPEPGRDDVAAPAPAEPPADTPAQAETPAEAPAEDAAPTEAEAPAEDAAPTEAEAPAEDAAPTEVDGPAEGEPPADAAGGIEGEADAGTPAAPEAERTGEPPAEPQADTPAEGGAPAAAEGGAPAAAETAREGEAPALPESETPASQPEEKKRKKKPKPEGPTVGEVTARIGRTSEEALAYVRSPDPKLSRLPRKVREGLIADLPAVTAAALLGPAALARHLVASAATGRYRDLFALWELFRAFPDECKPVLSERQQALARGQAKLRAAVRIGLRGRAGRVAEDIRRAEGLIWQWLRDILGEMLPAVGARPAVAAALLEREPDLDLPLPGQPTERWLAEAAAARGRDPLPGPLEEALGRNAHRLPATVETLRLATQHYPGRVPALLDRVDLDAPDIGAFLAWARDHDAAERLYSRIRHRVSATAARDRAKGLELWHRWSERGVDVPLPDALQTDSLEDFDLSRPETAALAARLLDRGVELDLQAELESMAGRNRQLAEKAYEAMVCAGLDVSLPAALEGNPIVREGTRCPKCRAWTWVRPGHEERCPRPEPPPSEPEPDPFELAAAEVARTDGR